MRDRYRGGVGQVSTARPGSDPPVPDRLTVTGQGHEGPESLGGPTTRLRLKGLLRSGPLRGLAQVLQGGPVVGRPLARRHGSLEVVPPLLVPCPTPVEGDGWGGENRR